jgi:cation:H+ antiporter
VFVAFFVAYVAYLLLDAADHDALPAFSSAMLLFVAPLTVCTLAVLTGYEAGKRRARRSGAGVSPPAR